jgi:formylglycine-generating enzyme required for sulfatase activity
MIRNSQNAMFVGVIWACACGFSSASEPIETVPVGNPGNGASATGVGSVAEDYRIGKYEVTAAQYVGFLNAVAADDINGLYNPQMWDVSYGCKIVRTGEAGAHHYSVAATYGSRPVNYVSWADAARFANWLHNGRPSGPQSAATTETGAYNLLNQAGGMDLWSVWTVSRQDGARWALPTEDEWLKAACHKNDGPSSNYFSYPTRSDTINISMANFGMTDGSLTGAVGRPTNVGSYTFPSAYGTYDMAGNVWEWVETLQEDSYRGLRGGSFMEDASYLSAAYPFAAYPLYEGSEVGFRVAQVPEPMTMALVLPGALAMLMRRPGARRSAGGSPLKDSARAVRVLGNGPHASSAVP